MATKTAAKKSNTAVKIKKTTLEKAQAKRKPRTRTSIYAETAQAIYDLDVGDALEVPVGERKPNSVINAIRARFQSAYGDEMEGANIRLRSFIAEGDETVVFYWEEV